MMKNYDGRWQSGPVEFCRWGCFWEQFQGKGAFSHVRQVLLLFWTKNYALIVSVKFNKFDKFNKFNMFKKFNMFDKFNTPRGFINSEK